MTISEIYDNGILKIAGEQKKHLRAVGYEKFLEYLADYKSVQGCLMMLYGLMLKRGMAPIQKLSIDEQADLFYEAARVSGDFKERKNICKSLHAISEYLKL